MFKSLRPKIYTVTLGEDLLGNFVDHLIKSCGDNPLAMTDILILLPNNRARAALTEAFVRKAEGGMLLPQMVAIGDLALDEALGPIMDPLSAAGSPALLPAIDPLRRQMLLTKLVRKQRPDITAIEALRLAQLLAASIDQLDIEEVSLSKIKDDNLEADIAQHWQNAYGDFTAILADYQKQLAALGLINPAARRNILLDQLGASLGDQRVARPVYAVGISTAAPAIARLLRRTAQLENGHILLPYVDLAMDEDQWSALGPHSPQEGELPPHNQEAHPQFHLKLLLERMGFDRSEITLLVQDRDISNPSLAPCIGAAFFSAAASETWPTLPAKLKQLPHIRLMQAEDSAEEARAIALLIRAGLEKPKQRIALVTPDRELAVRVAAQLKRWSILVDDSAGQPLIQSPPATLFLALAETVADQFGPVTLLTLLKHPLVMAGDGRLDWLSQVRLLDLALRGPRLGIGLGAIMEAAKQTQKAEPVAFCETLFKKFESLCTIGAAKLPDILQTLVESAGALSDGAIWKGEAGRLLARCLEEIAAQDLSAIADTEITALPLLITRLLDGQAVRPAYGGHPRIAIYGLLEARLQQADLIICAGLNEGTWPQMPQPDPWLAPRLRRELGLPGLDRNIGLSAHDLASALGAKEVVLSRAERNRSGPAVASRFLLRLQALLGDQLALESDAIIWARAIDTDMKTPPAPRPYVMPSVEQRRVDIAVTQIDVLKSDPYSFYAAKILRLPVLRAVGSEPDAAWRGTAIHAILEDWTKEDDQDPDKLIARAEALINNRGLHPTLRTLWQPRIFQALQWLAEETRRLCDEEGRVKAAAEIWGAVDFAGIRLSGKPDRIDRYANGDLAIVDYKTGSAPSQKRIYSGYALQLGLLALIAENGGFKNISGTATKFEYWTLNKNKDGGFGAIKSPVSSKGDAADNAAQFVKLAAMHARDAIENWIIGHQPFTAKLQPDFAIGSDYDHLMRLYEWYGRDGANDDR